MIRRLALAPALAALAVAASAAEPPRLAVVLSIDQCRADYLERFRPHFGPGGFVRLLDGGTVCTDAHLRHALTATAPGHATMLTGVHADRHGIIANDWFDAALGRFTSAVEDPASPLVGAAPSPVRRPAGGPELGASPHRLLAPTVGDELKRRWGARSRVIALSNKDRAAVLMGGRLADGAYWMQDGTVVTSAWYRRDLPAWVQAFNAADLINRHFGATWDRLLPAAVYDAVQGPDDAPGEQARHGLGTTFPRVVNGGAATLGPEFYNAYRLDPHSSEVLGRLAQAAIAGEQLGRHEAPDLLCVGFSQTDFAGHSYGPDSHEIMDSILRLDRVVADLLACLDREVGEGRYVVVLTGDHGVAPLPERTAAFGRGVVTGRIDWAQLGASVEHALTAAFGAPPDGRTWAFHDDLGYRLFPATLAARHVDRAAAAAVVKVALRASPWVEEAWTSEELRGAVPARGGYLEAWRLSWHEARSPDVVFTPVPGVVDRTPTGTNHHTPHACDTHVPLVWYGPGCPAGVRIERIGTDAIAPTLARLLHVPRPPAAVAAPLF